jgi:hypothetical protein
MAKKTSKDVTGAYKGGASLLRGLPSIGIWSGGFVFPANSECEYIEGKYEMNGGGGLAACTQDWFSYFAWPSGSGGKIRILSEAVYRVHFHCAVFMSNGANVLGKLNLLRGSEKFCLLESYDRIDQESGTGTIRIQHEFNAQANDWICVTLRSDIELHGAPNGQYSQLYVQLIGFPP